MSIDQARRTMDRYFALMGSGEHFAVCYRPDVTWSVVDTGEVIAGAAAVRAYVVALHASMVDSRTTAYVVGREHVYLEGDCAATDPRSDERTRYCVAYDIADDGRISAMRGYGIGGRAHR